jgi:5-methylcytosine-specific restriction endonuclease McrA
MEAALHTLEGRVTVLEAAFLEQHDLNIRLREEIEMIRGAHAERQRLYRARGGSKIPDDLRRAVLERDGNACLACGAVEYLACDHVVPVSKGGPTELGNLQTLCRACNSRKKDVFKRYGKSGAMLRSAAAERQRRYRERKKHGTDPQR